MQRNFLSSVCYALLTFAPIASAMGDEHHDQSSPATVTEQTVHASGTVKSIADNHDTLRIFHDPIPSLGWPSMNMPFEVVDHELIHSLEVGDKVDFEFIQKEDKNIIVRMKKK